MRDILEKDDVDKFLLFAYLEGASNQAVSISNIQNQFSLTYFKAAKIMDELMADFSELDLEDFFHIEKHKKAYRYSKNGLDSINRLLWIYGRRSLKMSFIDYFLKYPQRSIEEFSFDYYISLSKAYRVRNEVNDFLDGYGLNFLKTTGVSEKDLRHFLAELYFNIFKEYETPFDPTLVADTEVLVAGLQDAGLITADQGLELVQLKFYLYVTFLRNQSGHSDFSELEELCEGPDKIKLVEDSLRTFLENREELPRETTALLNFLQVTGLLAEPTVPQGLSADSREALAQAYGVIFIHQALQDHQVELRKALTPLFIKWLYYDNKIFDTQFFSDLTVFQENYPEIYQLTMAICQDPAFNQIFGDQQNNRSFQMVLMLKLIHTIPLSLLLTPVTITVDFAIGKEYNEFIASMVENLPFANLLVNNRYTKETDIYLSDILKNEIESKYVIWNSPPTAKDWEIFGNLVSVVKETKQQKVVTPVPIGGIKAG